ncbi:hypothetical protein DI270_012595, partial [Microbispora triticiradicis]
TGTARALRAVARVVPPWRAAAAHRTPWARSLTMCLTLRRTLHRAAWRHRAHGRRVLEGRRLTAAGVRSGRGRLRRATPAGLPRRSGIAVLAVRVVLVGLPGRATTAPRAG